ncbi:MAG: hypothetical protein M0Z49_04955 [Chloroflexi bacterium]|nr:hypothetical protein [Chloroflexota bacterium]
MPLPLPADVASTMCAPVGERLTLVGPSGAIRVMFLNSVGTAELEADVREVAQRTSPRPALAVAFGDVARRHKLEVRVVPRVGLSGPVVLVIFGTRRALGMAR